MAIPENSTDNENNGDNASIGVIPSSIVLDHNHPFYLHVYDGLGSMSVGLILTGMENYSLWSRAMKEESRKSFTGGTYGKTGHNDPTALFTAQSTSRPRRNYSLECDFCHLKGHTRNECYKLMKCEFCNKTGHLKENCYKIIGYPSDFKQKKKANAVMNGAGQQGMTVSPTTNIYQPNSNVELAQFFTKEQYNQLLQWLSKGSTAGASANMAGKCFYGNVALCENLELCKWIVDIGATNHMTGDKSLLKNETSVGNSGQVQLPTGDSTSISHMGECQLTGGDDLLSGRVKEIGRKEEGLYILSAALGKTMNRVFAATSKGGHDKFAPRAVRSVFLGYAAHQKGYRLLDLENRVFFISRDVVFYEDIFPFHISEESSEPLFLDITPVPRQDFDEEPNVVVVSSVANTHIKGTKMSCSPTLTLFLSNEQDISHPIEHNSVDSLGDSLILPPVEETRKSTRVSKPSILLKDYVKNDKKSSASYCKYSISEMIGYEAISSKYQSYMEKFSVEMEPTSYSKAVKDKR
ncbi:uncharacterized protein [Nicotiana sylvestris]|uniref:uncharacterized protein n=1 Tax=Nicotiana sylvestris TaxID=4096 RepID=UPI00388C8F59